VPDDAAGLQMAEQALQSGRALARFRQLVAGQGGRLGARDDEATLPVAEVQTVVRAQAAGYVTAIDAERIGRASLLLGAGRAAPDAVIDPAAGVVLAIDPGDRVERGAALAILHHAAAMPTAEAEALVLAACELGETPTEAEPLVMERITR
jgi:pyrimidine-nucleoside phosphorylase